MSWNVTKVETDDSGNVQTHVVADDLPTYDSARSRCHTLRKAHDRREYPTHAATTRFYPRENTRTSGWECTMCGCPIPEREIGDHDSCRAMTCNACWYPDAEM